MNDTFPMKFHVRNHWNLGTLNVLLKMEHFSSTTLNVLMPESTPIYAKVLVISEQTSKKYKNNYKLSFHNSRSSEDENNYQKSIFIFFMH